MPFRQTRAGGKSWWGNRSQLHHLGGATMSEDHDFAQRQRNAAADFVHALFCGDAALSEEQVKERIMRLRRCSEQQAAGMMLDLKAKGALVDDEVKASITVR